MRKVVNMNIFELITNFWRRYEEEITPTEAALYFFLVAKANWNHWAMPFACPTKTIMFFLKTSRQNISRARQSLKEKGLIEFNAGINQEIPTSYTLISNSQLSAQLTAQLSPTPYYNNINNKEKYISLKEIEEKLNSDENWQDLVVKVTENKCIRAPADILPFLSQFFSMLKAKGKTEIGEEECKTYFVNWIKTKVKNNENKIENTRTGETDGRSPYNIGNTRTKNYHTSF